ncbi:MAG: RagB/SusD family nutrient uptake outer membrane protein, partial [Bacteroidetes bacterium]
MIAMMKSKTIYLIILFALLVGNSCEDFLDKPIQGFQVSENYFATEEECQRAVFGCYESLSPDDWWQLDFFWMVGDVCSDEAFKGNSIEGDQRDFGNLANFNIHSNNEWVEFKWLYSYATISRCNLVIYKVPDSPSSEENKKRFVAEAKYLRAFAYFELVKNFGGVPVVLNEISAGDAVVQRSSMEEVFAQIEKDLKEASSSLPLKSEQSAEEIGRATKGAAQAFLAKAFVYQDKWGEAQTYSDSVISSGEYNLSDPFSEVWSIANQNGNGSIFEIQHSFDDIYYVGTAIPVLSRSRADGGWGFGTPSSYLEKAMEGDPRLSLTIIKEGDNVDADHPSYDTQLTENESGRINRKYYLSYSERPSKDEHNRSGLNHIVFRYADLLLLHAEIAYQNGNESAALLALNQVRARVSLSPENSGGINLLNAIYKERQLELAMEGHRYYDLKRTGRLTEVIQDFYDYNQNRSTDP